MNSTEAIINLQQAGKNLNEEIKRLEDEGNFREANVLVKQKLEILLIHYKESMDLMGSWMENKETTTDIDRNKSVHEKIQEDLKKKKVQRSPCVKNRDNIIGEQHVEKALETVMEVINNSDKAIRQEIYTNIDRKLIENCLHDDAVIFGFVGKEENKGECIFCKRVEQVVHNSNMPTHKTIYVNDNLEETISDKSPIKSIV